MKTLEQRRVVRLKRLLDQTPDEQHKVRGAATLTTWHRELWWQLGRGRGGGFHLDPSTVATSQEAHSNLTSLRSWGSLHGFTQE